jgi:Icc-related predicted phosphoesterase
MRSLTHEYPFLVDVAYITVEESGTLIGGVPGYDRDFWPSQHSDDDVVAMAREIWRRRDRSKPFVFLTHYPPAGAVDGLSIPTPDAGGSATVAAIVRAVEPDLVITGHYHQDFGSWGRLGGAWIVNPGPSGHILQVDRAMIPLGLP